MIFLFLYLLISISLVPGMASAQNGDSELSEVTVYGREFDLIDRSDSASEGLITQIEIRERPFFRSSDLFEYIPGMVAVHHSGGGKGSLFFLRGINLDHGTDFLMRFEGMPVNIRSHAHGNGYIDANFVIPELIKSISYTKGTHLAEIGDFSSIATSSFETLDFLDQGLIKFTQGRNSYKRLMAMNSLSLKKGDLIVAAEIKSNDGPWIYPEDSQFYNLFTKYTTNIFGMKSEIISTFYKSDWNATDQIPLRSFKAGDIDRYGAIDPSQGGETERVNLIFNLSDDDISLHSFFSRYSFNLFGNPTYFLNDKINGDQIEQEDDRWTFGFRAEKNYSVDFLKKSSTLQIGAELQHDDISDLNLFSTKERSRLSSIREDTVSESSFGFYTRIQTNWNEKFKSYLGFRFDSFSWDVSSSLIVNSGKGSDTKLNPKIDLVYLINPRWELTLNYGQGFHSNDVRAAELKVDPRARLPVKPYDVIIPTEGLDLGLRGKLSDKINLSMTIFNLDMDSALLFIGDIGSTEPTEGITVRGFESAIFWRPVNDLIFDLTVSKNKARSPTLPRGKNYVPDAHDFVAVLSSTYKYKNDTSFTLKLRHLGEAPITEDGTKSKDSSTIVNFSAQTRFNNIDLGLEVFNIFNTKFNDMDHYYESRLFNEPESIEGYHFHPGNGREARFTIGYNF